MVAPLSPQQCGAAAAGDDSMQVVRPSGSKLGSRGPPLPRLWSRTPVPPLGPCGTGKLVESVLRGIPGYQLPLSPAFLGDLGAPGFAASAPAMLRVLQADAVPRPPSEGPPRGLRRPPRRAASEGLDAPRGTLPDNSVEGARGVPVTPWESQLPPVHPLTARESRAAPVELRRRPASGSTQRWRAPEQEAHASAARRLSPARVPQSTLDASEAVAGPRCSAGWPLAPPAPAALAVPAAPAGAAASPPAGRSELEAMECEREMWEARTQALLGTASLCRPATPPTGNGAGQRASRASASASGLDDSKSGESGDSGGKLRGLESRPVEAALALTLTESPSAQDGRIAVALRAAGVVPSPEMLANLTWQTTEDTRRRPSSASSWALHSREWASQQLRRRKERCSRSGAGTPCSEARDLASPVPAEPDDCPAEDSPSC